MVAIRDLGAISLIIPYIGISLYKLLLVYNIYKIDIIHLALAVISLKI